MINFIQKILAWWEGTESNPWFQRDKVFHAWFHTLIVRGGRSLGFVWYKPFIFAVLFGIGYEYIFDEWLSRYFTPDHKKNGADWADIAWNVIGGLVGLCI